MYTSGRNVTAMCRANPNRNSGPGLLITVCATAGLCECDGERSTSNGLPGDHDFGVCADRTTYEQCTKGIFDVVQSLQKRR